MMNWEVTRGSVVLDFATLQDDRGTVLDFMEVKNGQGEVDDRLLYFTL